MKMDRVMKEIHLGYDLRLIGERAARIRKENGIDISNDVISFDSLIMPPLFVGSNDELSYGQELIDTKRLCDHFFTTFSLFRSDKEAVSMLGDPRKVDDVLLLFYSIILPDSIPNGVAKEWLYAIEEENIFKPSFSTQSIFYEIVEDTGFSISYSPSGSPHNISFKAKDEEVLAVANQIIKENCFVYKIHLLSHPFWLKARVSEKIYKQ